MVRRGFLAIVAVLAIFYECDGLPAVVSPPPPPRNNQQHLLFMKAPTTLHPVGGFRWHQEDPSCFSVASFQSAMDALNVTDSPRLRVGLTFQWELLDCFLSPHTCNTSQSVEGILNFLNSAVQCNVPVGITLDPIQFWYASGLWNWYDPNQPGFNPDNVDNVEWTGWTSDNATKIAWRNWGSQFRMPTPQPNLASPALRSLTASVIHDVVSAIRGWYEQQSPSGQQLLVSVKLAEEVDVGANFFFYPDGNAIYDANPHNASGDPTYGANWTKGIAGGLQPVGYNMLRSSGVRTSGGPPTREEITDGVRSWFQNALDAAVAAWPLAASEEILFAHGGLVGDPLLIEWTSAMVSPAVPAYSVYVGPGVGPAQPGLGAALQSYDPALRRWVAGEFFCLGCSNQKEWQESFELLFSCPYGGLRYASVYNLEPFLESPGAVEAVREFVRAY